MGQQYNVLKFSCFPGSKNESYVNIRTCNFRQRCFARSHMIPIVGELGHSIVTCDQVNKDLPISHVTVGHSHMTFWKILFTKKTLY